MSDINDIREAGESIGEALEIHPDYLQLEGDEEQALKQLKEILMRRIEELIEKDFEQLMYILYRIDVSEEKLKGKLAEQPTDLAAEIMADMVIERRLAKIKTRKAYRDKSGGDWEF